MKKGISSIISLLLILAFGVLSIRLFVVVVPQKAQKSDTSKGLEYIASLESIDGNAAENIVRKAQDQYAGTAARKKILEAIKKKNYRYAFKDIVISGDSIVKAIWEYDILDSSQVMAEIGGGTTYLKKISKSIIAANPKYLVLHFGENQLSTKQQAEAFAKEYGKCIAHLKKNLPKTEIYVDSIFPVEESAYKTDSYLRNIDYYNTYIEKMAKQVGVHYIDFTPLWASYKKNYYDADGIHPLRSYYTEQYLPQILMEVGYKVD